MKMLISDSGDKGTVLLAPKNNGFIPIDEIKLKGVGKAK